MSGEKRFRRLLRGAFRNALVWGAGFAAFTFPTYLILRLAGSLPDSTHWLDPFVYAPRFGFIGFVAGAAFSVLVSLLYRGRKLSEISWVRFGVVAGVATAVFVPLFLQTMNVISGGPIPWRYVVDDTFLGVFGAVAAAGSLKLGQLADKWFPEPSQQDVPLIGLERLIEKNLHAPLGEYDQQRDYQRTTEML